MASSVHTLIRGSRRWRSVCQACCDCCCVSGVLLRFAVSPFHWSRNKTFHKVTKMYSIFISNQKTLNKIFFLPSIKSIALRKWVCFLKLQKICCFGSVCATFYKNLLQSIYMIITHNAAIKHDNITSSIASRRSSTNFCRSWSFLAFRVIRTLLLTPLTNRTPYW